MHSLFFSALLFSLVYIGYGTRFIFPSDKPCMEVDMDASLSLSMDSGEKTTLDMSAAKIDTITSNCSTPSPVMQLGFPGGPALKMIFTKDAGNEVSLSLAFSFNASGQFNTTDTDEVQLTSGASNLGLSNMSYLCNSEQTFKFTGNDSAHKFDLDMASSNIHLQAFNFNGNFSEANDCDADMTSQAPQTSGAPTGESTSGAPTGESTSGAPTGESTSGAPVTPTTEPSVPEYMFKDCIIMDANIVLNVNYTDKNGTEKVVALKVPPPPDTAVSGVCSSNDTQASLVLSFGTKGKDSREVNFGFNLVASKVYFENVTVTVDLDAANFPDAKDANLTSTKDIHMQLSDEDAAFKCNSKVDLDVDQVLISTTELEVQAYDMKQNFSSKVDVCPGDKTSTSAPSTTLPPPTTTAQPSKPPRENYTVSENNTVCIVMQTRLQFEIKYETKNEMKTATINVVNDTATEGSCNYSVGVQDLVIREGNNWVLTFYFHTTAKSLEVTADDDKFYLGNVSFHYTLTKDLFPDAKYPGKNFTVRKDGMDKATFEASVDGSYKCTVDRKIELDNVTIHTTDFQYRAFGKDNSTDFSGNGVTECTDDSETNSIVPIAVGAALAALVIIVLIAYLIGRRRRNKGYESV